MGKNKTVTNSIIDDALRGSFVYAGRTYDEPATSFAADTPLQVKELLSKTAGKYAYWSTLLADLQNDLSVLNTKYDLWYAKVYSKVDASDSKRTEGWKQQQIYLLYAEQVGTYMQKRNELKHIIDKTAAITKAFEMQSRTLQTVAGIIRAELGMVHSGSGSFND